MIRIFNVTQIIPKITGVFIRPLANQNITRMVSKANATIPRLYIDKAIEVIRVDSALNAPRSKISDIIFPGKSPIMIINGTKNITIILKLSLSNRNSLILLFSMDNSVKNGNITILTV